MLSEWFQHDIQEKRRRIVRTLVLLLEETLRRRYGPVRLKLEYAVGNAWYVRRPDQMRLLPVDLEALKSTMQLILRREGIPERVELPLDEVKTELRRQEDEAGRAWYEDCASVPPLLYRVADRIMPMDGPLCESVNEVGAWDLQLYPTGILLRLPRPGGQEVMPYRERPTLFRTMFTATLHATAHRFEYVQQVNRIIRNGDLGPMILQEEAKHNRQIAHIADRIAAMQPRLKIVLIGGPSSAGKTSAGKRLQIELRLLGLSPYAVSLDDFYKPREEIPLNGNGEPDYERLEALDIPYLQETLLRLAAGEEVQLPKLDFVTHERNAGETIRLGREGLLILEGIHSLNPGLTRYMTAATVFKVYISALTHLNFDTRNRVSTTDLRLLRRMERDRETRGYPVEDTLRRWPDVRRGEQLYIFPHQEEADAMFNTAQPYELNILKGRLEKPLRQVHKPDLQPETERLLRMLDGVEAVPDTEFLPYLPSNSILREFVGGSALEGL
ncbi:hypothetical protein GF324_08165 [bacterium]|nr:hypothetical protein [bacterium]